MSGESEAHLAEVQCAQFDQKAPLKKTQRSCCSLGVGSGAVGTAQGALVAQIRAPLEPGCISSCCSFAQVEAHRSDLECSRCRYCFVSSSLTKYWEARSGAIQTVTVH